MAAARAAFRYLLTIFIVGVAVQFFLAGLGVFRTQHASDHGTVGDEQFGDFFHPHVVLGNILLILGIVVFLAALAGRMGRRWVLPALALPILVELQFVFANNGPSWFRALHVLNAFAIAGLAGSQTGLAWRERAPA
jgi:Family of unknown function (DUF6220)